MKNLKSTLSGIESTFISFCKALFLMLQQLENEAEHSDKLAYWLELALSNFENNKDKEDVFLTLLSLHDATNKKKFLIRYRQALPPSLLSIIHYKSLDSKTERVLIVTSLKRSLEVLMSIPTTGFDSQAKWERDFLYHASGLLDTSSTGQKILTSVVDSFINSPSKELFDKIKSLDSFLGDRERDHHEEVPYALRRIIVNIYLYKPFKNTPVDQGEAASLHGSVYARYKELFIWDMKPSKAYLHFLGTNHTNVEIINSAKKFVTELFDKGKISEAGYASFLVQIKEGEK